MVSAQSSSMDVQDNHEERGSSIIRPTTPNNAGDTPQIASATPVRHRGVSSAAVSSSKSVTVSKSKYEDMVEPIMNEISKPQDCKAADMIRFLFSFCGADGGTAEVRPKVGELKDAFSMAQELANEPDTPLRENLKMIIAAESEIALYDPSVKAFNYAFDCLSKFNVPGLPKFREERRIVFARSDAKCISSESYLQGSYKPDIVLLKWGTFIKSHELPASTPYSKSYESDVCCKSGCKQPTLGWRDLLSTVEVKLSGSAKQKAKAKEINKTYTGDFGDLQGDFEEPQSSKPLQSAPTGMVDEGYLKKTFSTRQGLRSQSKSIAPSTQPTLQKRRRNLQESRADSKRLKSDSVGERGTSKEPQKSSGLTTGGVHIVPKQPAKVQSAIYASQMMSSSFDVSHTITFILQGTSVYLTWIDRQNLIESRVIDLVDDLSHFLLLLLVLQRFDDAKWGHFTQCPQSGITVGVDDQIRIASFVANTDTGKRVEVSFYPEADEVYLGITMTGRGTGVIGAREGSSPDMAQIGDTDKLREGNNLVVKIYWPEEDRKSEADILKKAKEYGGKIHFIGNHIPEMVCHLESDFLCSSTKTVRQFLGLPTGASRRLRIIVFRRLVPIKKLKEKDMLTAYLQCFFCHFCLWKKGIHHGDISLGNLMWDAERGVGVLNDFDLARFADQTGASGQDNTGTLPFMALDLLSEEGLRGDIPRLYRHEAESFAWTLIYLYLSMVENTEGQNYTRHPHPLEPWFGDWAVSRNARIALKWQEHCSFTIPSVYRNTRNLAIAIHTYWENRYRKQFQPSLPTAKPRIIQEPGPSTEIPTPYEEKDYNSVFMDLVHLHDVALGFVVSDIVPLEGIQDSLFGMYDDFKKVDWSD